MLAAGVGLILILVTATVTVLVVSSNEEFILGGWHRDAWRVGAAAVAAAAFIGMALFFLLRQQRMSAGFAHDLLEAGQRLSGIIHSAMDAVITIDEERRIVLFNEAAEEIFGCPAREAIGSALDRFIPERFRAVHGRHVEEFERTGTTARRMGIKLALSGLRMNGEEFPIDASISQVAVDGKKFFTVILRDVTERRKAEESLQRAVDEHRDLTERLRGVLQSAMDAIITMDEEQRIVLFNEAAEKIFRCRAGEVIGGPLDRFIPERFRAAHRAHVRRFGETRVTTRLMGAKLALFGLRADGEEFPIDASISQITIGGRKLYTVILRDVTQRKRSEEALERSYEELRELSATMNEIREAERTRIARELHDELAQWLTALRMDVSWLASRLPREHGPLLERAEKMKGVVDTTVSAVRRIAADLRPVMLDDLGLVPAIEGLLHELSQRTGIVVSLEPDHGSLTPGEPVATAVYRMVQEALTNVARHAEATEVQVTMSREGETLVVRVRDNGRGFDPVLVAQKKSYGVLGIRERAYTLGGSARIVRVSTGGTLVEIEIPMTRFGGKGAADDTRTAG
jgi:PAS domain S-box-containing protein